MAGAVASFGPSDPVRVLVLAHGFPWPDGSVTDHDLAAYAQAAIDRWTDFAVRHRVLVVAPALGGSEFPGYREMAGQPIRPDQMVNDLVDELGGEHIPGFTGRFSLHGHSAGGQFAARYLVTHPDRLEAAVLSAPSTYPMPDPALAWPNGMGAAANGYRPAPASWLLAVTGVPVTVLVGSQDTEPRPPSPGQPGATRIERAAGWVDRMRRHAEAAGRPATLQLAVAPGLGHDETALAGPAQDLFARCWAR